MVSGNSKKVMFLENSVPIRLDSYLNIRFKAYFYDAIMVFCEDFMVKDFRLIFTTNQFIFKTKDIQITEYNV